MSKLSFLPALEDLNTPLSHAQLDILYDQIQSEQPSPSIQSQFNYAWGLIKSDSKAETKQGLDILIKIYKNSPQRRRECLYYLSLGFYKINELQDAKRYVEALLNHEPDNLQAIQLKSCIEEKVAKDGLIGVALVSGAVGVGAAALAFLLRNNKKR